MRYQSSATVIPTENKTLAIPHQNCPVLNKTNVSKLKVEKVENPPQKPMTTKKYQKFLLENMGSYFPNARPKIKTASRLAKNVPSARYSPR